MNSKMVAAVVLCVLPSCEAFAGLIESQVEIEVGGTRFSENSFLEVAIQGCPDRERPCLLASA